jgi:hypothetical protein
MERPDFQDVWDYAKRLQTVSIAAQNELKSFFSLLDTSNPEYARDKLITFCRALSDKYGPVSGQLAKEWYDKLRTQEVGSGYTSIIGSTPPTGSIEASTRYICGDLWNADPNDALGALTGMVDRYVKQDARNTIMENIANEVDAGTMNSRKRYQRGSTSPGFARVPTGRTTCAWCLLLAGRGYVYWSPETAGEFNKYHAHCDCVIVPAWGRDHSISGYDPSDYYDMYREARKQTEGMKDANSISATMRQMYGLS